MKEALDSLRSIRYDYSDEIPERIVRSTDPDNKYKVRAAWWSQLNAVIYHLEFKKLIDSILIKKGDYILEEHSKAIEKIDLTSKEDIDSANVYLDEIIRILELKSNDAH